MLKLDIDPRPRIAYLDISTRRLVASNFMGDYESVFKGRGIVFESFREYSQGDDDAALIDWKASKRAGKLLVKEYVDERNLDVFFLVDASFTMVFGSQARLKHEYAAEMVAAMSFAILDRGDSVGLGLFTETIREFIPPDHGLIQYRRILRELSNPANYDGPCNFEAAVRMCLQRLRPQTLIILVTDLVHLEGDWQLPLKVANRKFEVVPLIVRDPRDDHMPERGGHVMVENAATGEQLLVDSGRVAEAYERSSRELLDAHLNTFRAAQIEDYAMLSTEEDFPKHIVSFFERRKRRHR